MFEDSLVESTGRLRTKTTWTTMASFGLQIALIGVLVLIPLIYTEALPKATLSAMLVAPPPPPPPPPPPAPEVKVVKVTSNIIDGALRQPTKIPQKIVKIVEEEAPAPAVSGGVGVPGGVAGGSPGGVMGGILSAASAPPPKVAQPTKVRISSGVMAGQLLSGPKPTYPSIAKAARITGSVVLQATISKRGTIENLRAISGHPMLIQSAIDTVRTWRYKPYILNDEPVEVETNITVNFNL